jgi:hypothetical protein
MVQIIRRSKILVSQTSAVWSEYNVITIFTGQQPTQSASVLLLVFPSYTTITSSAKDACDDLLQMPRSFLTGQD